MGKIELRVEIDADLLDEAKALGVVFAAATEAGLKLAIETARGPCKLDLVGAARRQREDLAGAEERARQWAEENAEAIKAHNERVAVRGVFGDDLRRW